MFSKVLVVLIDDDVDGNLDFSREFCTFAICDANNDKEDMMASTAKIIIWWLKTELFPKRPAFLYSVMLIMTIKMIMMMLNLSQGVLLPCTQ